MFRAVEIVKRGVLFMFLSPFGMFFVFMFVYPFIFLMTYI